MSKLEPTIVAGWPYSAHKPNCLFCDNRATHTACYSPSETVSATIRCCEAEDCQREAVGMARAQADGLQSVIERRPR